MKNKDKTKEQLLEEITAMRQRIAELEISETERKKVEVELRESEDRFRGLSDADFDGIIIYEEDKIREANPSFDRMFGYKHEEVIDKSASEFVTLESYEKIKKNIQTGYEDLYEIKGVKKDGSAFELELIAKNCRYHGQKARVVAMRDITERKQAEKTLRDSNRKYSAIVENANDAIFLIDPKTQKILEINDATCKMTGYSKEELKRMYVYELHPEDERALLPEKFSKVAEKGSVQGISGINHITKDGKLVPIEVNATMIELDGKKLNVSIVRDISDRKKAEEELQEAHDLLEKRVKERTLELSESNAALKVLLNQREQDKGEFESNILSNVKHLVLPYITKLKKNRLDSDDLSYLNVIESNLKEIVSPFSQKLSSHYMEFTPREIQIANLIKDGSQDKDIMEMLNISLDTVKTHRKKIRRKLGIYGKRINLRTKLLSMT